ncbi:hypothetical protein Ancab_025976 [Ancistrocladus abbreviatus]
MDGSKERDRDGLQRGDGVGEEGDTARGSDGTTRSYRIALLSESPKRVSETTEALMEEGERQALWKLGAADCWNGINNNLVEEDTPLMDCGPGLGKLGETEAHSSPGPMDGCLDAAGPFVLHERTRIKKTRPTKTLLTFQTGRMGLGCFSRRHCGLNKGRKSKIRGQARSGEDSRIDRETHATFSYLLAVFESEEDFGKRTSHQFLDRAVGTRRSALQQIPSAVPCC